jgi:hypothetical protein
MSRDEIHRLAALAARLSPDHRNPEAFHQDKSELVSSLKRLASAPDGIRQQQNGVDMTTTPPKHAAAMSQHELAMNRARVRRGEPPDYEADDFGRQTPASRQRDAERREAGRQRIEARIAKRFS